MRAMATGRAGLGILVLVLPVLAGCIGSTDQDPVPLPRLALPAVLYDNATALDLWFGTSDGETIHATAYLPRGAPADARFGAIVQFSPYFTNLYGRDTQELLDGRTFNETTIGLFAGHGFAYVAASVPGTGRSTGCFNLGGETEQKRMAEFVEWIGQQEWSNGNVGMYGGSYDGTTPFQVAIQAPSALKTIVPFAGITDWYRYEYQDGAPYAWWGPMFLPYYLMTVGWNVNAYSPQSSNPDPLLFVQEDLCPHAADHFHAAETTYATGVYGDFWTERNYTAHFYRIRTSVLLVHGLQDWNVKPDNFDVFGRIPTEKHFWLGQWQHNLPWRNTFREEWSRPDWNATVVAWFDHYLNGADNGIPEALPAVWVQDSQGRWRDETTWPPLASYEIPWHLSGGGFSTQPTNDEPDVLVSPPTWTGVVVEPNVGWMGPEGNELTLAKFVSEPMAEDLRLSGVPSATLHLSVDRPGYHQIAIQMYNVSADGKWWWINEGGRGLAQRDGRDADDPPEANEILRVPVNFHPTETVIQRGERLAVLIAVQDPDWFHARPNPPIVTLYHDEERPSFLTLPLLPVGHPAGVTTQEIPETNPYWTATNGTEEVAKGHP